MRHGSGLAAWVGAVRHKRKVYQMAGRLHRPTDADAARREAIIAADKARQAFKARLWSAEGFPARQREMARDVARKADSIAHVGIATASADASHIGASDPHAREHESRLVPASIRNNRPADKDGATHYAGMYYMHATDRATGINSDPFGRTDAAHNRAVSQIIHGKPVVDALDNHKGTEGE